MFFFYVLLVKKISR